MPEEKIEPRYHVWFEGAQTGTYTVLDTATNKPTVLEKLPHKMAELLAEILNKP
ncbi:hypothetical protein ABIF65_003825 [Bradyrhizobium japonicum]|uniref:Uncharacterized protein n=1 Tax=Bradyrhizobium barranii subsp. barranii TaxID=2823807 RepID=A0A7Z0TSB7_9BRAD|nr:MULTISPECIES: hypothetical protein [Bradyrhizobium]WLC02291.1 hypothetical protein QIH92_24520 [Bradyrhizobium japonicum USDA 123]MBR1004986.1 hypothetical protein [Bradyrhizobium liaoningense]MBR1071224.1 hypothetical protein [Bradyrhizobium liaoningense]MCP1779526.1 hypothetical protein [Bradyrhizobium japonicum]MCP1859366.1 hypothetical protein [Bradyrhizobium japonicum]